MIHSKLQKNSSLQKNSKMLKMIHIKVEKNSLQELEIIIISKYQGQDQGSIEKSRRSRKVKKIRRNRRNRKSRKFKRSRKSRKDKKIIGRYLVVNRKDKRRIDIDKDLIQRMGLIESKKDKGRKEDNKESKDLSHRYCR